MAKEKKTQVQAGPTMDQVNYVPSLKKKYKEEIVGKLMKEFSYSTVMQVPRLVKITINQALEQPLRTGSSLTLHSRSSLSLQVKKLSRPLQERTSPTSNSVEACLSV